MKCKDRSAYAAASLSAIAMYAVTTLAANADVGVTVNGSAVDIAPAPIVQAGRVFVPLRGVFEQLGASVVYSNGTINATGNGRDISLQIGSTQATVNGQTQIIDVAPFIVGESTFVPLRFISEALGDNVSWDDADSIAAIDTGGGSADYYSPGTASYVDTAPPPIPVYDQPNVSDPNYIWQPGYWAWGSYGYYWVPGTWVEAPQPGYLWTPGYWQGNNVGFHWNPGYWARSVGYYGGVNYGCGYSGNGYNGGQWSNNVFRYNTYVTRVNTTIIRNVYIDRTVYVNNSTKRISYNGGNYGLQVRPTSQQLLVVKQRHFGMTQVQQQHVRTAEQDRRLLASVNHDKPAVLAVARPLSERSHPSGFVPVKASDRVDPLANVSAVHVTPRQTVRPPAHAPAAPRPVTHAPVARAASVGYHAPAVHEPVTVTAPKIPTAPAYHAPVVHEAAPAYHAPVIHEAAPAYHAPVVHEAAPAYHAPVVHEAAPAYHAPVVHEAAPAYHAPVVHEAPPTYHAPVVHEAAPAHVPAVYAAPLHRTPAVHMAEPQRAAPPPRAVAPRAQAAPKTRQPGI